MQQRLKERIFLPAFLFFLAFAARLLYIAQSADSPTFLYPTVDSYAYLQLAKLLAEGAHVGTPLFWQPIFYPTFLATVFRWLGPSILTVKTIQALVGATSCVLVYAATRKAFSSTAGFVAGLLMAFYGPLIFFETELLGEGWAVLWVSTLILLFIQAEKTDQPLLFLILGCCGALAVLTRPPLLVFFLLGCAGFMGALLKRIQHSQVGVRLGLIAIGFLLLALPIARINAERTGHFGILPSSSGINLYLGNNPQWKETVTARPGFQWRELYNRPYKEGCEDMWDASTYFRKEVVHYASSEPLLFAHGLLHKALRFFNSRELPRNVDLYLYRRWSPLLNLLVWKLGSFGFPFGLLAPLAIAGLVVHHKRIPLPIWALLAVYPPTIILYFVSARYRILILPALVMPAAAILVTQWEWLRQKRFRPAVTLSALTIAMAILLAFPPTFAEERIDYEAEMYRSLGNQAFGEGRYADALRHLTRALELQPDLLNALNDMCMTLSELGRFQEAKTYALAAAAQCEDYAGPHYNLGLIQLELGELPEAEGSFQAARNKGLQNVHLYINMGICFARQEKVDRARATFEEALRIEPGNRSAQAFLKKLKSPPSGAQ